MQSENGQRFYRFTYVLILTLIISAAFLFVIRAFILDTLLAAIFAGLLYPVFDRLQRLLGGRPVLASTLIVVFGILAAALPLAAIGTMVVSEATQLSQASLGWIRYVVADPQSVLTLLPKEIAESSTVKALVASTADNMGDIVNALSRFLSQSLSTFTRGSVGLFLDLFVIVFALVYFLQSGRTLVGQVRERIPLGKEEAQAIVDKTLEVTAATLKSIVLVGAVQGALVGMGFAVAGLGQPWFWGTIAGLVSAVPGLGSGLVWLPGAIYLALTGHVVAAIGLAAWGIAVVSLADNFLRLWIVGRGASMPSLVVLVSTLGGISVFGAAGILVGPVLAGTFLGVFDLYHAVLKSSGFAGNAPPP
ncbi:MAG: AI-2E family transporter [Alphaproteobacteria bacterium]